MDSTRPNSPRSALPFSALQIVGGCTVVIALLGAAYAVGRSQGNDSPPNAATMAAAATASTPATLAAAPTAAAPSAAPAAPTPAVVGNPNAAPAQAPSQPPSQAPVQTASTATACARCGTVTEVRAVRREGQATGIGAVGGAVLGGILGHQIGGGTGQKIATVGGAVAGGYAGNEVEKRQRATTVWIVRVEMADGRTRQFERSVQPDVRAGDTVEVGDKGFKRV